MLALSDTFRRGTCFGRRHVARRGVLADLAADALLQRYVDAAGKLIGFALTGAAAAHKNRLPEEMQPA